MNSQLWRPCLDNLNSKLKTRGIRRWEMIFFLYLTQNLTNNFADEEENICLFPTNCDQAGWWPPVNLLSLVLAASVETRRGSSDNKNDDDDIYVAANVQSQLMYTLAS